MRRAVLAATLVLLGVTGCRVLPGGPGPSGLTSDLPASSSAVSEEAPAACGFPPGTALEYAGRATTAELDVQEVVGDPMSDDPADIYITRDAFDQGELHGRLVCAIFVNDPGFVEVTVHPADGGRVEPVEPTPRSAQPPDGMTRDEAIAEAREQLAITIANAADELPEPSEWELLGAEAMPLVEYLPGFELEDWARDLGRDRWVWVVVFRAGDQGADVVMDYVDGTVFHVLRSIID